MSLDTTIPRSRRALLAAALGAAAATVAGALGRPFPVTAANGDVVHVGDSLTGTQTTTLTNTVSDPATLGKNAINGVATAGLGIYGRSASASGVYGTSTSGPGVSGVSVADAGVAGRSDGPRGGVAGASISNYAGVVGYSWSGAPVGGVLPDAPAKTGVYGAASQDVTARGVFGQTTIGIGVLGAATTGFGVWGSSASGCGVYGVSYTGTAVKAESVSGGTALDVVGKAKFSRAKKVTIGAGRSSLKVTLDGVTTASLVFAVLRSNRSGVYVRAVTPSAGYFTIYLNKAVTAGTYVAYFVVN